MLFLSACTPSKTNLSGTWLASYPGGPLKVKIVHTGDDITATLLDGNAFVPAGKEAFSGKFKLPVFEGQQLCAYPGFQRPFHVKVMIKVIDNDHFTEDVAPGSNCGGFPVDWVRMK